MCASVDVRVTFILTVIIFDASKNNLKSLSADRDFDTTENDRE